MKAQQCANEGNGLKHPRPCSADHIGPISLGFCHRPEFQLLCKSCNSAKNNRMYFSDVQHLTQIESSGVEVVTWYAKPIWDKCKRRVTDKESALRLSRIMRDNRNIAMMLLHDFMAKEEYLFLLTLLNLNYANYEYEIIPGSVHIANQIVTVDFAKKRSTLKYVTIQKIRKIRVAFSSLEEYALKDNRNGYTYTDTQIDKLKRECFSLLTGISQDMKSLNQALKSAIEDVSSEAAIEGIINRIDYDRLMSRPEFIQVKKKLAEIMTIVGEKLSSNWDDARYSREIDD